jgi:hypothetical protein
VHIIDFSIKGNTVRFYLGDVEDYTGDDWHDCPYEHNAGRVYDKYIKGIKDISFSFDDIVVEPSHGHANSTWTKEDMKMKHVPCVCVLPHKFITREDSLFYSFEDIVLEKNSIKYYFGDVI